MVFDPAFPQRRRRLGDRIASEGGGVAVVAAAPTRVRNADVDAVIESVAYRRFYQHATGHWLGRDVHDVGNELAEDEAPSEQVDGRGRRVVMKPSRVLRPGMVVTVEPGLYVRPAADVPEHFWHIGIRIEDDAVLTATGCELISREAPLDPAAIEALMNEAGPTGER